MEFSLECLTTLRVIIVDYMFHKYSLLILTQLFLLLPQTELSPQSKILDVFLPLDVGKFLFFLIIDHFTFHLPTCAIHYSHKSLLMASKVDLIRT